MKMRVLARKSLSALIVICAIGVAACGERPKPQAAEIEDVEKQLAPATELLALYSSPPMEPERLVWIVSGPFISREKVPRNIDLLALREYTEIQAALDEAGYIKQPNTIPNLTRKDCEIVVLSAYKGVALQTNRVTCDDGQGNKLYAERSVNDSPAELVRALGD